MSVQGYGILTLPDGRAKRVHYEADGDTYVSQKVLVSVLEALGYTTDLGSEWLPGFGPVAFAKQEDGRLDVGFIEPVDLGPCKYAIEKLPVAVGFVSQDYNGWDESP